MDTFRRSEIREFKFLTDIYVSSSYQNGWQEMIEISGYVTDEKLEIAKRYLIPKQFEETGIQKGSFQSFLPKSPFFYVNFKFSVKYTEIMVLFFQ